MSSNDDVQYEQAQEAVVPIGKALKKPDMVKIALQMIEKILTVSDSLTGWIFFKQLEFIAKQGLSNDTLKEKAMALVNEKEVSRLGTKCSLKGTGKKWSYTGTKFDELTLKLSEAKKELDDYCTMLELAKDEGVVNQATGAAEYAKCISEGGQTINVNL